MEEQLLMWGLGTIAVLYFLQKYLQDRSKKLQLERELDQFVSSSEHKVKGRFD